jgi:Leucine-rich repeat (LRR) protein
VRLASALGKGEGSAWIGNLTALSELDLDGNQLTSLPESMGNLTTLIRLYLDGNQLTSLPKSMADLTDLEVSGAP